MLDQVYLPHPRHAVYDLLTSVILEDLLELPRLPIYVLVPIPRRPGRHPAALQYSEHHPLEPW